MDIREIMQRAAATAKAKGFREEEKDILVDIALAHSELSEALEECRDPRCDLEHIEFETTSGPDKPTGVAVEFADTIIRICETCEHHGIPLREALVFKMQYNDLRPHRHGGKRV